MERTDRIFRRILLAAWIGIAVLLTGGMVMAICNGGLGWFRGKTGVLLQEDSVSLENVSSLVVGMTADDILLTPSGDGLLHIRHYGQKNDKSPGYTLKQTDGSITVTGKARNFRLFSLSFFHEGRRLELELPADYTGALELKTVSGDIGLSGDRKLALVKLSATSGDISVGGALSADSIEVSAVSGDLAMGSLAAAELRFSSTSGDIRTEELSGRVGISSISGDLHLEKVTGSVECSTTSGDIRLRQLVWEDASSFSSISGDIFLEVDRSFSGSCGVKTTSGDVNSDIPVSKESGADLMIRTTSGDVTIRK